MWKQKIGLSLDSSITLPATEVLHLLADAGFDAVSPTWHCSDQLGSIVQTAAQLGLAIQSLHAPFDKAADMWSAVPSKAETARKELIQALEACCEYGIPVLVVHTWIGFDCPAIPMEPGLRNYDIVVEHAQACNVQIAFENTEGEEYLFALMEHFQHNSSIGFCWDSGHELCYNHSQDLLGKLGDRLIMTHLNDNLGISRFDGKTFWTDDLHLLPYDGIADWDDAVSRLARSKPQEYLNFELSLASKPGRHENDVYRQMGLPQYLAAAYQRACRIAWRYAQAANR